MDRKPALIAGIAAASVAAVVAATPAIVNPVAMQDVRVTACAPAPLVKNQVTVADIKLAAFTLEGLLDAWLGQGYHDLTYNDPYEDPEHPNPDWDPLSGVAGVIYYTVDNLLPAAFDYDDDYFVHGVDGVVLGLADDIGVPQAIAELAWQFVNNPIGTVLAIAENFGLPPVIGKLVLDPIMTVVAIVRDLASGKIPDSFFPFGKPPGGSNISSVNVGVGAITVSPLAGVDSNETKKTTIAEPDSPPAPVNEVGRVDEVKEPTSAPGLLTLDVPNIELPNIEVPKIDLGGEKVKVPKDIASLLKKKQKPDKKEPAKDASLRSGPGHGMTVGGATGGGSTSPGEGTGGSGESSGESGAASGSGSDGNSD